jgi:two-component system, cell cycle response regulator
MKVFIVDDEPGSRLLLSKTVEQMGHEPVTFATGEEFLSWFPGNEASLVLMDWMLPGIDGLEVCRSLCNRTGTPRHYIILVSAREDSEDIREALETGASDYIIKGQDPGEMRARIGVGVRTVVLERDRTELYGRLHQMARIDSFTGLLNHTVILEELTVELSRGERERSETGLLMIDLDHFKAVNDTYGHPVGDGIILQFSKMLRRCCRPYDRIGRYGGDEFLVILPKSGIESCLSVAARLRTEAAKIDYGSHVQGLQMTFSAGACSSSHHLKYSVALVAAADSALYKAKAGGRDRTLTCKD